MDSKVGDSSTVLDMFPHSRICVSSKGECGVMHKGRGVFW